MINVLIKDEELLGHRKSRRLRDVPQQQWRARHTESDVMVVSRRWIRTEGISGVMVADSLNSYR